MPLVEPPGVVSRPDEDHHARGVAAPAPPLDSFGEGARVDERQVQVGSIREPGGLGAVPHRLTGVKVPMKEDRGAALGLREGWLCALSRRNAGRVREGRGLLPFFVFAVLILDAAEDG